MGDWGLKSISHISVGQFVKFHYIALGGSTLWYLLAHSFNKCINCLLFSIRIIVHIHLVVFIESVGYHIYTVDNSNNYLILIFQYIQGWIEVDSLVHILRWYINHPFLGIRDLQFFTEFFEIIFHLYTAILFRSLLPLSRHFLDCLLDLQAAVAVVKYNYIL